MDIRELRYFASVAENLNFSVAARELFVTQSTISYQIGELETRLGLKLFVRDKHSVQLTPGGEILFSEVKNVLIRLNKAINNAHMAMEGSLGKIRIGHFGAIEERYLRLTMNRFNRTYPNIEIDTSRFLLDPLVDSVEQNEIDVGFTFNTGLENRTNICSQKLNTGKLALFLPPNHPLAAQSTLKVSDLQSEPMVHFHRDTSSAGIDLIVKSFLQKGISPNIVRFTRDIEHLLLLIQSGVGVTVLPSQLCKTYPFNKLCCIDLVDSCSVDTVMIWKKEITNPSVPLFLRRFGVIARLE